MMESGGTVTTYISVGGGAAPSVGKSSWLLTLGAVFLRIGLLTILTGSRSGAPPRLEGGTYLPPVTFGNSAMTGVTVKDNEARVQRVQKI